MPKLEFQEMLDAGVHFGHLRRKWNPAMAPYIFMERNGIHIIDLHKTAVKIDEAAAALKQIAKSGRKILFVATKKQAKEIVADKIGAVNMPYVVERWPGGMLTNFPTIRKAVKKMTSIDRLMGEQSWESLSKREKLQIGRQRAKMEKTLGSIADLNRLPAAMFVVDVMKEQIAVKEAIRLNIPIFAMVDTNSNPKNIDYVIPANDDSSKSIELIVGVMADAVKEGLSERKVEKDSEAPKEKTEGKGPKKGEGRARVRARKEDTEEVEETTKVEKTEKVEKVKEPAAKVEKKEKVEEVKEPAAKVEKKEKVEKKAEEVKEPAKAAKTEKVEKKEQVEEKTAPKVEGEE